ncbi:hypothetical protein PIB30_107076 [Stylosanthes scabra]|uniref:Uncharacterized protein n=1 Tax=Stylosanthes scabra TaxID=79078 RepID=A0ABU6QZS3_9FABA|nr:hypothetical protein [Stylosanthes scabra]
MVVNSQPSSSSNPLPSQPLPNPKGGINVVQTTSDKDAIIKEEEDDEEDEDEEDDDWLYDLLAKLAGVDSDSEDEYEDIKEEETSEEDEEEEMIKSTEEATKEEIGSPDKEYEFFIATVYGGNEEKPEDLRGNSGFGTAKKTTDTFHLVDTSTLSMVGIAEDVIAKV